MWITQCEPKFHFPYRKIWWLRFALNFWDQIFSRETTRNRADSYVLFYKDILDIYLTRRRRMIQDPNDPENHLIGPYIFNSSILCFNASLIPKQPTNSTSLLHIPLGIPNTKLSINFGYKSTSSSPIPFGSYEISYRMSLLRRSRADVQGVRTFLGQFVFRDDLDSDIWELSGPLHCHKWVNICFHFVIIKLYPSLASTKQQSLPSAVSHLQ